VQEEKQEEKMDYDFLAAVRRVTNRRKREEGDYADETMRGRQAKTNGEWRGERGEE
jgi:hypothetical protein